MTTTTEDLAKIIEAGINNARLVFAKHLEDKFIAGKMMTEWLDRQEEEKKRK
jgi:hypothetical protein